jgi:hypothetical protein
MVGNDVLLSCAEFEYFPYILLCFNVINLTLDLKGSRASREYIDTASLMMQPILMDKL